VFVTLSARWSRPDLFIVARASNAGSEPKLVQAGADRVINPHAIGGSRMAALIVHPNVADFLDVVMHDRELEVRLSEVELAPGSPFCGSTLAACEIRSRAGVTVLGLRRHDGTFVSNPPPDSLLDVGDILIALGTADQHAALEQAVAG
jgi:voltage-gated potassium channel